MAYWDKLNQKHTNNWLSDTSLEKHFIHQPNKTNSSFDAQKATFGELTSQPFQYNSLPLLRKIY